MQNVRMTLPADPSGSWKSRLVLPNRIWSMSARRRPVESRRRPLTKVPFCDPRSRIHQLPRSYRSSQWRRDILSSPRMRRSQSSSSLRLSARPTTSGVRDSKNMKGSPICVSRTRPWRDSSAQRRTGGCHGSDSSGLRPLSVSRLRRNGGRRDPILFHGRSFPHSGMRTPDGGPATLPGVSTLARSPVGRMAEKRARSQASL